MSTTFIEQRRTVTALFCWSTDNCPDDKERIWELKTNSAQREYYSVPNNVTIWGGNVVRDHIDSLRHAAVMLTLDEHSVTFAVELDNSEILILTDEIYTGLRG